MDRPVCDPPCKTGPGVDNCAFIPQSAPVFWIYSHLVVEQRLSDYKKTLLFLLLCLWERSVNDKIKKKGKSGLFKYLYEWKEQNFKKKRMYSRFDASFILLYMSQKSSFSWKMESSLKFSSCDKEKKQTRHPSSALLKVKIAPLWPPLWSEGRVSLSSPQVVLQIIITFFFFFFPKTNFCYSPPPARWNRPQALVFPVLHWCNVAAHESLPPLQRRR